MGNIDNGNTLPKIGNGNSDKEIAVTKTWKGNCVVGNPVHKIWMGNTDNGNPLPKIGNGNSIVENPIHEIENGQTGLLPPLPAILSISAHNIFAMRTVLKEAGFNKVKYDARDNTARLLIHFYNKGGGGYPELKKLTSLTKYGLAKFIRSLKKED